MCCKDGVINIPKGSDGVGIESTSYDDQTGILTINYTDGSSFQTGDLRGSDGIGITNVVNNGDGSITIFYGNGQQEVVPLYQSSFSSQSLNISFETELGNNFTNSLVRYLIVDNLIHFQFTTVLFSLNLLGTTVNPSPDFPNQIDTPVTWRIDFTPLLGVRTILPGQNFNYNLSSTRSGDYPALTPYGNHNSKFVQESGNIFYSETNSFEIDNVYNGYISVSGFLFLDPV